MRQSTKMSENLPEPNHPVREVGFTVRSTCSPLPITTKMKKQKKRQSDRKVEEKKKNPKNRKACRL